MAPQGTIRIRSFGSVPERILVVLLVAASSLTVTAQAPERRAENNVIISERDPKVRIELPKSVSYVGADRWDLSDIADCELHAFRRGRRSEERATTLLGAVRRLSPNQARLTSSI